jgi:hypothetical protein
MRSGAAVTNLAKHNANMLRLSVTDWRQEDYHHGCSYLLVTRDGETCWELWKWSDCYLKIESGHDILDNLLAQGLTKVMVYRAMSAFARCIKRANSFDELKAL